MPQPSLSHALVVAVSIALSFEHPKAQQTVQLHVLVADASGRPVPNLSAADFEVRDNGRPRPVLDVRGTSAPLELLILIDASSSLTPRFDSMTAAAERIVAPLRPDDRYQIGVFTTRLDFTTHTSDRDVLIKAMAARNKTTAGTAIWDVAYAALASLTASDRRPVLVIVSDGEDTASRRYSRDDVVRRAQEQDVVIHAMGVRLPESMLPPGMRSMMDDRSLRAIAEQTGGSFLELTPAELKSGIATMARELSGQYVVTFAPERADGKLHDVTVRMTRADFRARAKRRFMAPR